jgi:hypothetical protein
MKELEIEENEKKQSRKRQIVADKLIKYLGKVTDLFHLDPKGK